MNKTKSLGTALTEADFNSIKKLAELNLPTAEIILLSKRSFGTVTAFKRFNTFEEYKEYSKAKTEKYKLKNQQETRKVENKPIVNVISLDEPEEKIDTIIDNTTDTQRLVMAVNRMADNMERLAKAWEKQPEKKGWLK